MKKLFVAVLALGALASCQKENLPSYADTESKSIQIAILNENYDTRAEDEITAEGSITAEGKNNEACAYNDELVVLFADKDGVILHYDFLVGEGTTSDNHTGVVEGEKENFYVKDQATDKYLWHNVPAEVKNIAVVRYEDKDITITKNSTNISDLKAIAEDPAKNIARGLDTIILYGESLLKDTGATHYVDGAFYHIWQANVTVAPAFARFEINKIMCEDLGTLNADVDSEANGWDATTTYDLDELLLNSLTWKYTPKGGEQEKYSAPGFGKQRLYGKWNPTADELAAAKGNSEALCDTNTQTDDALRLNYYQPAKQTWTNDDDTTEQRNGVWSWNVLPGTFNSLTLDMTAFAYAYTLPHKNLPLEVIGLSTTKEKAEAKDKDGNAFVAGHIYTIDLTFNQNNIKEDDGICVEVKVTVQQWVVEPRYPIYSK